MASTWEDAAAALSPVRKEAVMLQRMEMDEHVPLGDQLAEEVGPVTLINTFTVAPEDADALLAAWAADAAYLKPSRASSPPSSTAASPAVACS
jgi:hypothetical protein